MKRRTPSVDRLGNDRLNPGVRVRSKFVPTGGAGGTYMAVISDREGFIKAVSPPEGTVWNVRQVAIEEGMKEALKVHCRRARVSRKASPVK